MAENLLYSVEVEKDIILDQCDRFFSLDGSEKTDTIVLGCTHFPLLQPVLQEEVYRRNKTIQFIDSSSAILRRLATVLVENKPLGAPERYTPIDTLSYLYVTGDQAIGKLNLSNIKLFFNASAIKHFKPQRILGLC
jgi:glutamate racemase